ncbi:MAG: hypothetical protein ABI598_06845 [Chloroflexota bacterium]
MSSSAAGPRILAIMGSGETAPTMARVHRALFDRLSAGGRDIPATIVDTPYGFQENADSLSARTLEFFSGSVGRQVTVATYPSQDVDEVTLATAVGRIRESRFVMAGPGSPSYALRQWTGGPIPDALASKLTGGGVLTMASAAALTLGVVTIPVYEIYKVGEDPRWLEGLDLLGPATGLRAAVVPHYDNAEGGNHDTRFCYIGERRLQVLEKALPDGAFILGVDSHTALVLDLQSGHASVAGLGGVTVRVRGESRFFPTGTELPIHQLGEAAANLESGARAVVGPEERFGDRERGPAAQHGAREHGESSAEAPREALPDSVSRCEGDFRAALAGGDIRAAVAVLLEFDDAIAGRVRAGEDSPDLDNASATYRSLIARLGETAELGARDPRSAIDPFVTALLELRAHARTAGDWATADFVRDRLVAAGVEVRDETGATSWTLGPQPIPKGSTPPVAGQ